MPISRLPVEVPEIIDAFVHLQLPGEDAVQIPREALRDEDSLAAWPRSSMVDYLFHRDPERERREHTSRDLAATLGELDHHGISRALTVMPLTASNDLFEQLSAFSDRLFVAIRVNPHDGMTAIRRLDSICKAYPIIRAISLSPFSYYPHIALNAKEYYPVYSKAVELELAVYVNVGFPGPRVPAFTQDPFALDEVCWFFPDLRVVMRHGGEPWTDVCVKMLLRWPNLYYATTAFAPKYYPLEILQLCNKRAPKKIIWAGYWPILSYERIFRELARLPLEEHAWPRFLGQNAIEAFNLLPTADVRS